MESRSGFSGRPVTLPDATITASLKNFASPRDGLRLRFTYGMLSVLPEPLNMANYPRSVHHRIPFARLRKLTDPKAFVEVAAKFIDSAVREFDAKSKMPVVQMGGRR